MTVKSNIFILMMVLSLSLSLLAEYVTEVPANGMAEEGPLDATYRPTSKTKVRRLEHLLGLLLDKYRLTHKHSGLLCSWVYA